MLDIESSALIDLLNNERGHGNPALKGQLQEVAEECERSGKSAFEVIENYGIFTREQMLEIIADNLGSYVWDPRSATGDIDREVIDLVERDFARTHNVVPISADEDTIYLAYQC